MVYYLLLPFFSILLVVLQTAISDILFSGLFVLEISVIMVIYAGFRLSVIKGALLAFTLGLVFDCLAGYVVGLFALIYVLIFLLAFFASEKVVIAESHVIAFLTFIFVIFETFIVAMFYKLIYDFSIMNNLSIYLFLQALIASLLSPVFFYIMRQFEVFFYDEAAKSAERA